MPLQQHSPPGGGTHPIYRRPAPQTPFSGCTMQRVPSPCHLSGCCELCAARRRCRTRPLVDTSIRHSGESTVKAAICCAISVSMEQRNNSDILTLFCKITSESFGVSEPLPTKTTRTRFESSTAPSTSGQTEAALTLGQSTLPAPRLPYTALRAHYDWPGWSSTRMTLLVGEAHNRSGSNKETSHFSPILR